MNRARWTLPQDQMSDGQNEPDSTQRQADDIAVLDERSVLPEPVVLLHGKVRDLPEEACSGDRN